VNFRRIKFIFALCVFYNPLTSFSDTIKVHFIGYGFKNETYKIFYNGLEYSKKTNFGTDAFAINIFVPDSIKNGQRINMRIYRRGNFRLRFIDTQVKVHFESNKNYLVVYRDFKLKNRYSFTVFWTDVGFIKNETFWDSGPIPDRAKCDRIRPTEFLRGDPLIY